MKNPRFLLLSGSASSDLSSAIARILSHRLSPVKALRFPDGEQSVQLDEAVRGQTVFIIQSTSPPATENLFELLLMIDACRRAAAGRITAVVPYLGYSRADKRHGCREPITASMVASLFQTVGLNHLITIDIHAPQIEGFYHLPVDNLTAVPTLCDELKRRIQKDTVVVSPDEGRFKTAGEFARILGTPVAVIHKERFGGAKTRAINVIGHVRGRHCLIIDDMIVTGGTIGAAVTALLKAGGKPGMIVAATHGLFVNPDTLLQSSAIKEVIVTNTTPTRMDLPWNVRVVSIAPLLAAAIQRLSARESISDLFK